ncbi:MAG: ATP-binding cassette domain-containing protein [Patescibacteria group bacterium]|nr:ATP-binding cassette domain-containing protein [Patescibacteria group bacterium]
MIIKVENLTKEYKTKKKSGFFKDLFWPNFKVVKAVDNISFSIEKGESVALLGPNGAGKTTTMKMLSGLVYPTGGKIEVLGFSPFERKREFLMKIGLVMGNKTGLDWDLTPAQSFQLIKKIYRISDGNYQDRIKELTEMLGVDKFINTQVRKLSLGERMKLELVGAILHNPEVLFLDEPTIGLDIISKQKIRQFLRKIQADLGVTLLLTSHDMDDVEKVCDRVMVINNGTKVYDDSLENLTRQYNQDRYVKVVFKELPAKPEIETLGETIEEGENYYLFKVKNGNLPSLLAKVTSEYKLLDMEVISIPLEEIIADIYHKSS